MAECLAPLTIFSALPTPEGDSLISGWLMFLIVVVVFVLPFVAGQAIAKALKLKDVDFRISVILLTFILGISPFVFQAVKGRAEARHHTEELTRWEEQGQKYKVTSEGAQAIGSALSNCEVRF